MIDPTLTAILPKLVKFGQLDEPDSRYEGEIWFRLELEARCGDLRELMKAHPQTVPGLRQALDEVLDRAEDMLATPYDLTSDLREFVDDLHTLAQDPGGQFAQEAVEMTRAQERAAQLAQRPATRAVPGRRRS